MERKGMLYEGKAGKVHTTEGSDMLIVSYKDDVIAFNGLKKGTIVGEGAINNCMINFTFKKLEGEGVPTHLVEKLDDRETTVKKVEIVPLEVIIRNYSVGNFAKKTGVEEGAKLKCSALGFGYKNDDLGDPFTNSYYALTPGFVTQEEIDDITEYAFKINEVLQEYLGGLNIDLIDLKTEFGRYHGKVTLADKASSDTCRLWDRDTHKELDEDRLKRDLGNVEDAYEEVFRELGIQ